MTPEQLDEIEKLAEAATPGPYQAASVYPAYGVFRVQVNEASECVALCAVSMNENADDTHVERQEAHTRNGANARAIAALLKHALPLVKAVREARSLQAHWAADADAKEALLQSVARVCRGAKEPDEADLSVLGNVLRERDEARSFMLEAAEVRQALDAYRVVPEKETSAVRMKALITQRDEALAVSRQIERTLDIVTRQRDEAETDYVKLRTEVERLQEMVKHIHALVSRVRIRSTALMEDIETLREIHSITKVGS